MIRVERSANELNSLNPHDGIRIVRQKERCDFSGKAGIVHKIPQVKIGAGGYLDEIGFASVQGLEIAVCRCLVIQAQFSQLSFKSGSEVNIQIVFREWDIAEDQRKRRCP